MIAWLLALAVAEPHYVLVGKGEPSRSLTHQEVVALEGKGLVWTWTDELPPLRRPVAWLGRPARKEPGRLQVTAVRSERTKAGALQVIAAPARMWQEVAEALLPRWPVPENGRLTLPVWTDEPWQVRVVGSTSASLWKPVEAGRPALEVLLQPASTRELAVRGPAPLRDLRVRVYPARWQGSPPPPLASYEAGEGGRLSWPAWPDGAGALLLVEAADLAPAVVRVAGEWPRTIQLQHGYTVTGTLVDENGQPVNGGVAIESWAVAELALPFQRAARTDAGGRFILRGLPAGAAMLVLGVSGRGVMRREVDLVQEDTALGTVVVPAGHTLRLRVVAEDGIPVAGAFVSGGLVPVRTDALGLAAVRGLPAGEGTVLKVTASGFLPAEQPIPRSEAEEVTVTLRPGVVVRGRVVDAGGEPLVGARASVRVGCDAVRFAPVAVTEGRFEATIEPETPASLLLESPSTRQMEINLEPGQSGEARDLGDLTLSQGAVLVGRVVGVEDLAPLPGVRVRAARPSLGGPRLAFVLGQSLETTSTADGSFRLAGLAAGVVQVLFETDRRAPLVRRFEIPAEGDADAGTVALASGATVRVRTKLPAEVHGAQARVECAALAGVTESLQEAVQESEAIFAHVPPGPATVQLLADGVEVCSKRVHVPRTGELRVDCPARTAQVRGTVRIGGELAGPGTLVWRRPGADDAPEGIVQTRGLLGLSRSDPLFSSSRPVTVAVDERGRFGPLALPSGRWEVRFHGGGGAAPARQVEVPEGRECVLAIDMPGTALTGWAVDADERPVGGAVVSAEPTGASTVSGADGRFALIALPPGRVSVEAREGERRSQKLTVELTEDRIPEPVRLRLVPPDRHELAITVRTGRGEGAAGAVVVELDATIRLATADAAGQASVGVAAPFPSEVRAFAFTGAALGVSDRMPWEVARRRGVSLTLPEPAGIEVESASRGPRLFFEGSDVTTLLRLLGVLQPVPEGQMLVVWPLPPGNWTVAEEGCSRQLSLHAGERARVSCR